MMEFRDNSYYDGAANRAVVAAPGTLFQMYNGEFIWQTAASVAAGATQTYTERMKLTQLGVLMVNTRPVIMAACRVRHNANQTIVTGTDTVLAFNTEDYDTDTFHDTVTNNNRLTIPAGLAGKYRIWCMITWGVVADTTWRALTVRLNGSTPIGRLAHTNTNSASFPLVQNMSFTWNMAAGDYVELQVNHQRGANLDVLADGNLGPIFGLERVG
jgi:hypothetical protein